VLEYVRRPADVFDHHLVGPRVAEVIFISTSRRSHIFIGEAPQAATQSDEDGVFGIVELVLGKIVEMEPIELPVDREAVQMRIGPTHCGLDDVMELRQLGSTGDRNTTPHGRVDVLETDTELKNGLCRHPRTLRRPSGSSHNSAKTGGEPPGTASVRAVRWILHGLCNRPSSVQAAGIEEDLIRWLRSQGNRIIFARILSACLMGGAAWSPAECARHN
jgi:hypothetical protein